MNTRISNIITGFQQTSTRTDVKKKQIFEHVYNNYQSTIIEFIEDASSSDESTDTVDTSESMSDDDDT